MADSGEVKKDIKKEPETVVEAEAKPAEVKTEVKPAEVKTEVKAEPSAEPKQEVKMNGEGKRAADSDDEPLSKRTPVKQDDDSSDDEPLAKKISNNNASAAVKKEKDDDSSSDDEPLSNRTKKSPTKKSPTKKKTPTKRKVKKEESEKEESEDDDSSSDDEPLISKVEKNKTKAKKPAAKKKEAAKPKKTKKKKVEYDDEEEEEVKEESSDDEPLASKSKSKGKQTGSAAKRKKKEEEEEEEKQWLWWEDMQKLPEGTKWKYLSHLGPVFPPEYQPLPSSVYLKYDGNKIRLNVEAEEIATFYAAMLETDYVTDAKKAQKFNKNFFKGWREAMTAEEKSTITELGKCDFTIIHAHLKKLSEERKNATKEEKLARKERDKQLIEEYGYCTIDGHKQKIGNFRIEPPGLFRGRGDHPKMGKLKKRVRPEHVTINISADAPVPPAPNGGKWGAVTHDNTVTWLASWTESVQGAKKYVMLAAESHLKGMNDMKKYEVARNLKKHVGRIREDYREQLRDKEMLKRQRATALYLIDKLALRAGGEKDADEEADTVGCCNLRVEHVKILEDDTIELDFLGKDSIRYYNAVKVDHQVCKNITIFKKNKVAGDDLFDRLNTSLMNQYLSSLMPGLTAKVFRTYNASTTLQEQLKHTPENGTVEEKVLAYNRANREVAVLCNHQRAPPKTHGEQVEKMDAAMEKMKSDIKAAKKEYKKLKTEYKKGDSKVKLERAKKKVATLENRLHKKQIAKTDKEENKTIALGTSKLNYLDPRISVAWCRKYDVPIEKVYNETQRKKFRWAIEMTDKDYVF